MLEEEVIYLNHLEARHKVGTFESGPASRKTVQMAELVAALDDLCEPWVMILSTIFCYYEYSKTLSAKLSSSVLQFKLNSVVPLLKLILHNKVISVNFALFVQQMCRFELQPYHITRPFSLTVMSSLHLQHRASLTSYSVQLKSHRLYTIDRQFDGRVRGSFRHFQLYCVAESRAFFFGIVED